MRGIALVLALAGIAAAQTKAPVAIPSPTQDKNFYLLSMLQRTPSLRDAVAKDPGLKQLAEERLQALTAAVKDCGNKTDCLSAAVEWNDTKADEAGKALGALYKSSAAVRNFVDGPLHESGMYVRYNSLAGDEMLARAWSDCVRGMDRMIDVYALGKAPRYPAIDSITYDPKAESWKNSIQSLAAMMVEDQAHLSLFFEPALRFALESMQLNHRDEAGRLEPMEAGENAAAVKAIRTTVWSKYPYTVIVVPGAGNDRNGVRLSPDGHLRDEIAAKRWREGKAPFILVSGGYVHPSQTEYAEALEMKHDLMTRLGVPASAIIVDPHARHTTTNMRNAARLMYRYGIPFEKKALVSTTMNQSEYIENPAFAKRNIDELGYVPYRLLGRVSPFDLEFLPVIDSLHIDPQDPLDP